MTLSIIIPVFNEEKTIAKVIERVLDQDFNGYDKQIIVVDDGSTDKTGKEIEKLETEKFVFLSHSKNLGKGAAIKTALEHVTGDVVIVQDADMEYNPADINLLIKKLESSIDVVYGSRELHPERRGYPHYVLGVRLLTFLVNLRFKSKLTDVYTCYKLFPAHIIKSLDLKSNGFEIEMELTVKTLKKKYKIKEVAINYTPRKFVEGKKIRFRDAIKGVLTFFEFSI
jgi:glycosyltransferase involved in cell wall biosynthesis